jgi:two-component system chemotaxis sensor kinase CheA
MNEMVDLIPEFVEESFEHLKNIEEDIILIEQGEADKELINRVFRAVHSIKGGSSFLGLKHIELLSHKMEDIFNMVRNGDLVFRSAISTVVLSSIDQLKNLLENVQISDSIDVSGNLRELAEILKQEQGGGEVRRQEIKVTNDDVVSLDEYKLKAYQKKGQHVYLVKMELLETSPFKNPLDFIREIEKTGEIIELRVDTEMLLRDEGFTGEGIPLRIIYATVLDKDLMTYTFSADDDRITEIRLPAEAGKAAPEKRAAQDGEPGAVLAIEDASGEPLEAFEEDDGMEEDEESLKDYNEYLTFTVGEEEYGITIQLIQEIITMQPMTPVPESAEYMMGVINLRGDIIPVFDFRRRLSFGEREYDAKTITLVAKVLDKKIGIIVDRVSEVIGFKKEQINDAPPIEQIPGDFLIGIGQKDQRFVFLLKIGEIFKSDEAA